MTMSLTVKPRPARHVHFATRLNRRVWLHWSLLAALMVPTFVAGCAKKSQQAKPRVVTLLFQARESTNEGRPMTVVVQENGRFTAGPPTYEDVVRAASDGKNLLGKIVVYPGHESTLRLSGLAIDTQLVVSALYTQPSEHWQRQVNLGKREQVTIRLDMRGIMP